MAQFLLFLLVRTRVDFVAWRGALHRLRGLHPHSLSEERWRRTPVNTTAVHRGVHHIQCMCIYYFTWPARILQQRSVDTINYQLYFHFIFLSLISLPDGERNQRGAGENSYPMPETICFINHENWIDRAKRNLPLILIVIHRARARLKFLSRRASRASSSTSIFRRN